MCNISLLHPGFPLVFCLFHTNKQVGQQKNTILTISSLPLTQLSLYRWDSAVEMTSAML